MALYSIHELAQRNDISHALAWRLMTNVPCVKQIGNIRLFDESAEAVIREHLAKRAARHPAPMNQVPPAPASIMPSTLSHPMC